MGCSFNTFWGILEKPTTWMIHAEDHHLCVTVVLFNTQEKMLYNILWFQKKKKIWKYFHSFLIAGKIRYKWHLHNQEWLSIMWTFHVKKCKITCPYSQQQNYFFILSSTDLFQGTQPGRAGSLPCSLHPQSPYIQDSQAFTQLTTFTLLVHGSSIQKLPPAFTQVWSRKWPSFSAVLI